MDLFVTLISQYGYAILFPLAIFEGPIITIIGGFFVRLGLLNPFWVYVIVVMGDMFGDTLYYVIGRFLGQNTFFLWLGRHMGVTEERLTKGREYFAQHGYKTIMVSKLAQGLGPIGLVAAGSTKVPYVKYMLMCFSVTCLQSAIFLMIGILFGHAYDQIGHYLNYFAGAVSVVLFSFLLLYMLYRWKHATK